MRNAFQTLIDACNGDKQHLTRVSIQIAEAQRSIYDAILKSQDDPVRAAARCSSRSKSREDRA